MMRPIDADALMEQPVWFCGGWVGDSYAEGYMDALDKVEETIKSAPTIDIVQKWIPCDERLPESKEMLPKKDGSYLVCVEWVSGKKAVGDCEYTVDYGFRTVWDCRVLAWMPLPDPYKGGANDGNK